MRSFPLFGGLFKDFTPSEAVANKKAIEPEAKAAARARHKDSITKNEEGQFTVSAGTADTVPPKSRTSTEAEQVVDTAEADPERFGSIKLGISRAYVRTDELLMLRSHPPVA